MRYLTRWTAVAVVGGVLALGGLGAVSAQVQTPPGIDAEKLADELGLTGQDRAEIVAELQKLDEALARREQLRSEAAEVRGTLSAVFSSVLPRLTPEQRRILRTRLAEVGGGHMGLGGHMRAGGMMDGGTMGGGARCSGAGMGSMGPGAGMGAPMHRGRSSGAMGMGIWR